MVRLTATSSSSTPPATTPPPKIAAQEIADNDYNLNIPRYIDTFEGEAEIDLGAVKQEIAQLEGELATVHQKSARRPQ